MPSTLLPRPSSGGPQSVPLPLFEIETSEEGDTFSIGLKGELDLSECGRLDCALAESEASDARRIVLDLDELTFIDASGLYCLIAASERSAKDGSRLRVTPGRGDVATILHLTSIDLALPLIGDR